MTVCTTPFIQMGRIEAAGLGIPDLAIVTVPHPLADRTNEQVVDMACAVLPEVIRRLAGGLDA